MEATGIYSMPVYHAMIEHGPFAQVLVCNPGHVKNMPGRKTDYADAEWLAQLLECGLLNASFIPTAAVKAARMCCVIAPRLCSSAPRRSSGSGRCCRTPGSSWTRWPPASPPSPAAA